MVNMLLACCIASYSAAPTAGDLLQKYEEGSSRIHAISAVVELKYSDDGGQTWRQVLSYVAHRSGQREYVEQTMFHAYAEGRLNETNITRRLLTTPEGRTGLSYVGLKPAEAPDPSYDPLELELSQKKITGQIDPPQPFGSQGYRSNWMVPALLQPADRYTLRDLWEASKPTPVEGKDHKGRPIWDIRLKSPTKDAEFLVSLDPAHNYQICRVRTFDAHKKPVEYFGDLFVSEFQEPKPGIYIPKVIKGIVKADPNRVQEVLVRDVNVNEPVADDVFQLKFPAGIVVFDTTQDNCYHIWGDGKPAMTFKTPGELNQWKLTKMSSFLRNRRDSGSWTWKLALLVTVTGALLILFRLRASMRRGKAKLT